MEPKELETLLAKVGGKYKLVTLYQKRMRELQRGLPRLVENDTGNIWDTVSREILDSKVDLIMGAEAEQMRKELALREAEEAAAESESKGKKDKDKGDKDKAEKGEKAKAAPVEAEAK